jgi:hypothetical protein
LTGTFITGGVTYNYEAVMPESLIFIYSPHIYTCLKITDGNGDPVKGMKVQSVIMGKVYNGNEYRYTNVDGIVRFDIGRLLQMMTDDRKDELSNIEYRRDVFTSWNTGIYMLQFYVDGARVLSSQTQYLNGSHFIADNWWGNERRLKWWSNYPFTFDFVNTRIIDVTINNGFRQNLFVPYNGSSLKLINRMNPMVLGADTFTRSIKITSDISREFSRAFTSAFSIYDNKTGWAIINGLIDEDVENVVRLEVDNCPANDNRTYMRWLGKHGEVFYWLFYNQAEEIQASSDVYITSHDDLFKGSETNKILDNGIVKDVTIKKTRTIFTEPVDSYYYDYIVQIADSPYVDMYLGNGKWQRVNVQDASFSKSLKGAERQKKHRFVYTIEIGG